VSGERGRRRPGSGATLAVACLATLLLAPAGWAQDPEVDVFIVPNDAITDTDPIQLIIRVGGNQSATPMATLPEMTNLRVIGGPSSEVSITSRNRVTTRVVSLTYTLLAEKPGTAEIPSFEIVLGSDRVRTEPIRFEVLKGSSGRPTQPGTPRPGGRQASVDAFLEARVSAEEVWLGQPVSLSVTLFGDPRIRLDRLEAPSFQSFWVEEDEVNPDAESYHVNVGGRPYKAYPLRRAVLIPTSPGEYTIDPWIGHVRQRVADRGFFSFGRMVSGIRKTEPIKIRVKDLPAEGRPPGFAGAVGTFQMEVDLDRTTANVDDAVALTVTVTGEGFLKPIGPPVLDAPPDLKVFPPKPTERLRITDGRMVSRKVWEWVLVPLAVGELRLPEIRFSYFDPADGRYHEAGSQPLLLTVDRGEGGGQGPVTRGGVRVQRRDINFIKTRRGPLAVGDARAHQQTAYTLLAAVPVVLGPLLVVVGRRRSRLRRDHGLARARRARARARKRLASVRRRSSQLDSGVFHEEISRALVDYAADRFNLSSAGLTYDRLDHLIGQRGADADLRRRFRACLEACDFARFVPSSGQPERRLETLDEATALLDEVEKQL
jgi:hypothetical protein